ncbi:MAG: monovalent cation/H+ antiporter subunit D [Sphingomonadales bacterium]
MMELWQIHRLLIPIALPLAAAVAMLLLERRGRQVQAFIGLASVACLLATVTALVAEAASGTVTAVYMLGDWPIPFSIALVADRLTVLMLLVAVLVAAASLVFSLGHWHRVGVHFHPLFQLLLMGINGAILTGDLFNLFVFFEVMLAASYGLVLHGTGIGRVKAGLHFIAVNLAGAAFFLMGVSLIYGVTGTLNIADLARRLPHLMAQDRGLLEAGAAFLGIAFLLKAGIWPLGFWVPATYSVASPPVAAMLAVTSKIGIYAILRLWLLLFGEGSADPSPVAGQILLYGGLVTIVFGTFGALASQTTTRLAAFAAVMSSGTILAALGLDESAATAGALFYLVSSTLGLGAFFLLIELTERDRAFGADVLAVTSEAFGDGQEEGTSEEQEVSVPLRATMATLGVGFLGCTVLIAGIPPLSGFVAKFTILLVALGPISDDAPPLPASAWWLAGILVVSSLAALLALIRAGMRSLWDPDREIPYVRLVEVVPIGLLLILCVAMTVMAEPAMRFAGETAKALHEPTRYVGGVLGQEAAP